MKLLLVVAASWVAGHFASIPVLWAIGQAAPDAGNIDIVSLITQGVISGVFLWLYLRAEAERKATLVNQVEMQKRHDEQMKEIRQQQLDLVERMAPLFAQAIDTLDSVQRGMEHTVEHISTPRHRQLELELQQASHVVVQLQETLDRIQRRNG